MKKFTLILFIFLLSLKTYSQKNGHEFCSQSKINNNKTLVLQKFTKTVPTQKFDVQNYTLNLDLFNCFTTPFSHYFTATDTVTFKALESISSVKLNAANNTIDIMQIGEAGISYTHTEDTLAITLNQTYNAGEIFKVAINYTHKNIEDYSFYAQDGMVFTDCEPQGARNWYPCFDSPSDKSTFCLTARVPNNVLLGSNGLLVDSAWSSTDIYYKWETTNQIATYLVSIAAKVDYKLDIVYWTNFSGEKIPMRFYYNDGENPVPMENMMSELTQFFSTTFCEHPFPKNGFASLNTEFSWGGMENQSLTNICPDCWYSSLIVHEFGHQWFGDMITCATWADIWLNEGFATYSEALWLEHADNSYDSYKTEIDNNANSYIYNNSGRAIYVPAWINQQPSVNVLFDYGITYLKSSCVIHLLRYTLGDDVFFNFLKSYSSDDNFKYKSVTTQEFNEKLNTFTNSNYDWFFEDWLMQPNHPFYKNIYSFVNNGTNWTVNFTTKQTQANTFFRIPMQIKIKFEDNTEIIESFFNETNNQTFSFEYTKKPISLTFDPNNEIVLKQGTTTITGIVDLKTINFQIIPNLITDKASINFELTRNSNVKIIIQNIIGEEIEIIENNTFNSGIQQINWNTQNLEKGIYFVKLIVNDNSFVQKVVLQ